MRSSAIQILSEIFVFNGDRQVLLVHGHNPSGLLMELSKELKAVQEFGEILSVPVFIVDSIPWEDGFGKIR